MYYRYFAYGSNLSIDQMQKRCPEAQVENVAYLPDYRIAFHGHSPRWEGAPATVIPEAGSMVPGLIYRITWRELMVLDDYEGHPDSYERREMELIDRMGNLEVAQVYIKEVDGRYHRPPADYLGVIREAYRQNGFDREPLQHAARELPSKTRVSNPGQTGS